MASVCLSSAQNTVGGLIGPPLYWKLKKPGTDRVKFLPENLEKFRSTEHNHAHLDGSTIFCIAVPWDVPRCQAVD